MIESPPPLETDMRATGRAQQARDRAVARRRGAVALAVMAIGLVAAACGGGSGPGVASLGSTTTTTSPSAVIAPKGSTGTATQALAYGRCMQTHGVPNWPDPGPNALKEMAQVNFKTPQFQAAYRACQKLIPQGAPLTPAESQKEQVEGLQYAHCMQTHGEPSWPDPSSEGVIVATVGAANNSPALEQAAKACESLLPRE